MFSALLDSSPLREPVLRRLHWVLSGLVGVVCFGVALSIFHAGLTPHTRLAVIAAAGAGLAGALQTLMLCWVFADATRSRLRAWPWLLLTLCLSVPGFLIYLAYSAQKTGDWKRAAIPMAYVFQIGLLCLMVMLPLIYTQALPELRSIDGILPPTAPARYRAPSRPAGARPVHPPTLRELLTAAVVIPHSVPRVIDPPGPPPDLTTGNNGVPGGTGAPGGVPYGLPEIGNSQPLPPPPPAKNQQTTTVHLGGQVQAAKLIYGPTPEYPPLARMARVQGTVRIEALINTDGTIQGLKLINGPPLLTKAAMDAVARWRYQPTLLNGDPVEVQTEIDVVFTLAE